MIRAVNTSYWQRRVQHGITTREELGGAIRKLRRSTPITEQFNTTLEAARRTAAWNGTQKQIWLRWLASYDGPGPYARRRWDRSASFIYNRIAHPTLLLWLAEAAGSARHPSRLRPAMR